MTLPERTCSRCASSVAPDAVCPTCTAWWEGRPDVDTMTPEERVVELDSWGVLEIEFSKIHQRIEELVGRPVFTHELASWDYLRHEILTGQHPTMEGVIAKLPADMPVRAIGDSDVP